ncbi:MAG: hypothetical protein WA280_02310 [Xanthobacteraceae bacterium]
MYQICSFEAGPTWPFAAPEWQQQVRWRLVDGSSFGDGGYCEPRLP